MSVNTCKFFPHSFTGKIINIYIEHFHWNNEIWKTIVKVVSPQNEFSYGFSPECVLMCVFTLPACKKNFEHSLQENGFSPEWVLMCNFKPLASVKHFEHCL